MFWDLIVHLDAHLAEFVARYGAWVYALLFVIVFCETGLVVTPFLPGDSLLFVAGTLAALGEMDLPAVIATLIVAALCGDNSNYWIGRWAGMRLFGRWINPAPAAHARVLRAPRQQDHHPARRFRSCAPAYRSWPVATCPTCAICVLRRGAVIWVGRFAPRAAFGNIPSSEQAAVVVLAIVPLHLSWNHCGWCRA